MRMKIIKRSGAENNFDVTKIRKAIAGANNDSHPDHQIEEEEIEYLAQLTKSFVYDSGRRLSVEEIQDFIEDTLLINAPFVAKKFIKYREARKINRTNSSLMDQFKSLMNDTNEELAKENSNKMADKESTKRDLSAGLLNKEHAREEIFNSEMMTAHDEGLIHIHDMDYASQNMYNCALINIKDMFENETMMGDVKISSPNSFATASTLVTQIIHSVSGSQYGGQSINLAHLVPYIDKSRQKYKTKIRIEGKEIGVEYTEEQVSRIAELRLKKEIEDGVQTIQHQILTFDSSNGQTPFVTMFMYLNDVEKEQQKDYAMFIEEILIQRMKGVPNAQGVDVTPAFPKLIYVLDENNVTEDSEFWYLTQLSARCTAKRLVPDYVSAKVMKELKVDANGEGHVYAPMGCRSILTPYINDDGEPQYWGRFNQGVVTINLPDVALSSGGDEDKFWRIFDDRLELIHRTLQVRHERLKLTKAKNAPILWMHGAIARIEDPEETIEKYLYGGYSTISLGFAGLYECTKVMTGNSHTSDEGHDFAKDVMQYMNDKTDRWKAEENIDYSIYGTPLESTTYKFARSLQRRFGIIEGLTEKEYITNSYHIHVTEEIDAFSKLKFESEFQALSPGGAISYVETSDLTKNIDAVLALMKFIYENIMYAELNTRSDYCQDCGYEGAINIIRGDSNEWIWECPNCMNRDRTRMNIAIRVCGYIGTTDANQGRNGEYADRVEHLSIPLVLKVESNEPVVLTVAINEVTIEKIG